MGALFLCVNPSGDVRASPTDTLRSIKAAPTAIVTDLQSATSMDLLRDGTVAISEAGAFHVSLYNQAGQRIGRIGSYGFDNGDFADIGFIQALPSGRLLVTDRTARRVQLFDSRGIFVTSWLVGDPAYPGLPASFVPSQAIMDGDGRLIILDADKSRLAVLPPGSAPAELFELDDPDHHAGRLGGDRHSGGRLAMALSGSGILVFSPSDALIHRYAVNGMHMGFMVCPPRTTAFHADESGIVCASTAWLRPARQGGEPGHAFTDSLDGHPVALRRSADAWYVLTPTTLYRIGTDMPPNP